MIWFFFGHVEEHKKCLMSSVALETFCQARGENNLIRFLMFFGFWFMLYLPSSYGNCGKVPTNKCSYQGCSFMV